jgi:type I restriction enzyme S subunit
LAVLRPAEGIKKFPAAILKRVEEVADIGKDKRDPIKIPDLAFQYIDISAVDVNTGMISSPQDVEGSEAPSRARKVVSAFDVLVSTCRPTRGAIAVVPVRLHNEVASTGFSILRARANVNPFNLHYALRLPSTLEQFRKWSTGSSYPAILDSDVKKTLIPVPRPEEQDAIAEKIVAAFKQRTEVLRVANAGWTKTIAQITAGLCGADPNGAHDLTEYEDNLDAHSIEDVRGILKDLPVLTTDGNGGSSDESDEEETLFSALSD